MRTSLLLLAILISFSLSSCKKSRGTMGEMRETAKMAVIPVQNTAGPEAETITDDKESALALHLDALASSLKVDAILSIYAGQHSANPSIKKFAKNLGKISAEYSLTLKALSSAHDFPLPVSIIPVHENNLSSLKGKRKGEFDLAYVAFMGKMLEEREVSLEILSENATIPELRQLADDQLKEAGLLRARVKKFSRDK